MMGFGIRTAEDVRPMKEIIDGAIVGSHFYHTDAGNTVLIRRLQQTIAAHSKKS